MVRTKSFTRQEVLSKAIPLFWKRGFAATSLQDLEEATGVNRSGLYSEFADKGDLYSAALIQYIETRGNTDWLLEEPLGWGNIEKLLSQREIQSRELRGCLMVFAVRELSVLTEDARKILVDYHALLRKRVFKNVEAARPKLEPTIVTEMVMVLFSGLALSQNLRRHRESESKSLLDLIDRLKRL